MKRRNKYTVSVVMAAVMVIIMAASASARASAAVPQMPEEKVMFGRLYERIGRTSSGASLYANLEDDRAKDYVIKAIEDAGITDNMDDLEKAHVVNAWIGSHLEYADYATKKGYYKTDYAPFTDYCLLSGKAVCAGYAEAFQSMCCALGIECWYVTGNVMNHGEPCYHAWNCVVIDGESYHVDTLLNDNTGGGFCIPDEMKGDYQVEKLHETFRISSQRFPFPDVRR